jgi:nucleotide-binding universal stress UspA family protein
MDTTQETATVTATPASAEPKVVICYDGSEHSRRSIDVAAKLLGPRAAVVVSVGAMPADEALIAEADAFDEGDYENIAFDEEGAKQKAAEGTSLAKAAGFAAEAGSILASPAWIGIVDMADKVDAPVIVVGSRGLKGLKEGVEGSTSHDLAVHAGRPVLIVPPEKSA